MREIPLVESPEPKRDEGSGAALPEIRCRRCRRLLMKGEVKQVEVKCPKCGYVLILIGNP